MSDRVRRPFTAALEQDELEALVEPAVVELFTGQLAGAGGELEAKAETFLGVASGSGVEVPEWLERLGSAVDRALEVAESRGTAHGGGLERGRLPEAVPWKPLAWDRLQTALAFDKGGRG